MLIISKMKENSKSKWADGAMVCKGVTLRQAYFDYAQ